MREISILHLFISLLHRITFAGIFFASSLRTSPNTSLPLAISSFFFAFLPAHPISFPVYYLCIQVHWSLEHRLVFDKKDSDRNRFNSSSHFKLTENLSPGKWSILVCKKNSNLCFSDSLIAVNLKRVSQLFIFRMLKTNIFLRDKTHLRFHIIWQYVKTICFHQS